MRELKGRQGSLFWGVERAANVIGYRNKNHRVWMRTWGKARKRGCENDHQSLLTFLMQ